MTTSAIKNTSSTSSSKHETAKQWLQRRLRKQPVEQPSKDTGHAGLRDHVHIRRPQTAPSTGNVERPIAPAMPTIRAVPLNIPLRVHTSSDQPLIRQTRLHSRVVRDVNAWLDASMSVPSPPLMAGLTYWRTTTDPNAQDSASVQHAMPIVRKPDVGQPSTFHGHPSRPVRRKVRKIGVQMPSLARNKFNREAARKHLNQRSNSAPNLTLPYEVTRPGDLPALVTRSRSFLTSRIKTEHFGRQLDDVPLLEQSHAQGSPASTCLRTSDGSNSIGQRMHACYVRSVKGGDSTRSSGNGVHITRENSMGDISEAPTYSSGPPPPSYRSRTASILTTSSFGCVDGMTAEQRQISQQRAAHKRSMKSKLKKFAQNFTS